MEMSLEIIFLAAACLFPVYGSDFRCPQLVGLFRDPFDCTQFFFCSFGHPFRQRCPSDLVFDEDIGVCRYASEVHCLNGTQMLDAIFRCPASHGIYRDPLSCQHFYICANGRTYRNRCPPGTYFDGMVCNFRANARCPFDRFKDENNIADVNTELMEGNQIVGQAESIGRTNQNRIIPKLITTAKTLRTKRVTTERPTTTTTERPTTTTTERPTTTTTEREITRRPTTAKPKRIQPITSRPVPKDLPIVTWTRYPERKSGNRNPYTPKNPKYAKKSTTEKEREQIVRNITESSSQTNIENTDTTTEGISTSSEEYLMSSSESTSTEEDYSTQSTVTDANQTTLESDDSEHTGANSTDENLSMDYLYNYYFTKEFF